MKNTALALALALALAGCTGGGATDEPAARGTNAPAETVTVTAEPEPAPSTTEEPSPTSEEPSSTGTAVFGQTWAWDDGLTATITGPEPFTPSEWSAGGEGAPAHVAFTILIVNGSAEPFDPSMTMVTAQSGNVEAEQVFDTENGFEGSPMTTVLPGREASYKVGFGVMDPADIVLEFSPSFEHDASIWTQ